MPKTNISEELYQYALKFGVHEHPVLTELRIETAKREKAIMQIPPDQGQLMALLAKLIGAKKYLEIGVFTGYSSLVMALAMGKNSKIVALDNDEKILTVAKHFWQKANVDSQIEVLLGTALTSLDKLIRDNQAGSFDIAFIDANKSDYLKYYEYCYQLVRIGGIILIDNTLFYGDVIKENPPPITQAIKEFNQFIYNDSKVEISLLAIADGLTIAYKKE